MFPFDDVIMFLGVYCEYVQYYNKINRTIIKIWDKRSTSYTKAEKQQVFEPIFMI